MIRSWSHQLLIIYILTLYVLYTKIGVGDDMQDGTQLFDNKCVVDKIGVKTVERRFRLFFTGRFRLTDALLMSC